MNMKLNTGQVSCMLHTLVEQFHRLHIQIFYLIWLCNNFSHLDYHLHALQKRRFVRYLKDVCTCRLLC